MSWRPRIPRPLRVFEDLLSHVDQALHAGPGSARQGLRAPERLRGQSLAEHVYDMRLLGWTPWSSARPSVLTVAGHCQAGPEIGHGRRHVLLHVELFRTGGAAHTAPCKRIWQGRIFPLVAMAQRSECPSKNSRMRTSSSNAYRPMHGRWREIGQRLGKPAPGHNVFRAFSEGPAALPSSSRAPRPDHPSVVTWRSREADHMMSTALQPFHGLDAMGATSSRGAPTQQSKVDDPRREDLRRCLHLTNAQLTVLVAPTRPHTNS